MDTISPQALRLVTNEVPLIAGAGASLDNTTSREPS